MIKKTTTLGDIISIGMFVRSLETSDINLSISDWVNITKTMDSIKTVMNAARLSNKLDHKEPVEIDVYPIELSDDTSIKPSAGIIEAISIGLIKIKQNG